MVSFTQCLILFTFMLLPAITHAAVVEVDSKGVGVWEDAEKLMRQKGEVTPDLTKFQDLGAPPQVPEDLAAPPAVPPEEVAAPPQVPEDDDEDDEEDDVEDEGPLHLAPLHLFSGTECQNCAAADGENSTNGCAKISRHQCLLLNDVFGSASSSVDSSYQVFDIVKTLLSVRFECEDTDNQWKFDWKDGGCVFDCNVCYGRLQRFSGNGRPATCSGKKEQRELCKKREDPQEFPENPFQWFIKRHFGRFQNDLRKFLADPMEEDYSIKVKGVWQKLTKKESASSDKDDTPIDEEDGWAVRDMIAYLRRYTEESVR